VKKISLVVLSVLSLMSISVMAKEDMDKEEVSTVSGNISLANDYIWRGLPQHVSYSEVTKKDEANPEMTLSGGFENNVGSGFTIGVWGSNVSLGESTTKTYNSASFELDYYINYSNDFKGVDYEIGYIVYDYPNANDNEESIKNGEKNAYPYNFKEAYVKFSYEGFGLSHYLQSDSLTNYSEVSYVKTIDNISTSISYGDYNIGPEDDNAGNTNATLGFTLKSGGLDYKLTFTKTDYDEIGKNDENYVVLGLSKAF
jgi:uncharacterized protein (TIGR02001 family)